MTEPQPEGAEETASCYRHPQREAHIRCGRCNRRICPDCMVDAAVGFQCPECVRGGNRDVRQARTRFGGRVSADPGYVSKALILINVVAYLIQRASPEFTARFYLVGSVPGAPSIGVADGEYYRLLTAAFLHGGLLHLALNMYAIWLFGPPLEAALGRVRFLSLYLISAVAGNALSYAISPYTGSLGASGAVFGLLGAYLIVARRTGGDARVVLVLLAINFAFGFFAAGTIDWRAHLGGLIAGVLCAAVLVYAPRKHRDLVQAVGLLLVLVGVFAVVALRTAALT